MANLTNVLNEQIRRVARREIGRETRSSRKVTSQHRRDIAAMKRQVAELQKLVTFLQRQERRRTGDRPLPQVSERLRFRADGLKSHRSRLALSAADYGRLVGVSGQSVYNWETGRMRPRKDQVAKLAAVRGLGKREAAKRLEILNGK